ncbi:MAG: hypothetical protein ACTHN5_22610 [Phycisphaerae bacterium]
MTRAVDFGGGEGAEFLAIALFGFEVGFVGLGEKLFDGEGDAAAHRVLAVAAVDDDIEAAGKGELEEVAGDDVLRAPAGSFARLWGRGNMADETKKCRAFFERLGDVELNGHAHGAPAPRVMAPARSALCNRKERHAFLRRLCFGGCACVFIPLWVYSPLQ